MNIRAVDAQELKSQKSATIKPVPFGGSGF